MKSTMLYALFPDLGTRLRYVIISRSARLYPGEKFVNYFITSVAVYTTRDPIIHVCLHPP